jgi:hypothetical protein
MLVNFNNFFEYKLKVHTISIFVIVDVQRIFHALYVGTRMFMKSFRTRFPMYSNNPLLVIAIKATAK